MQASARAHEPNPKDSARDLAWAGLKAERDFGFA
jgi:hypothetical protein